MRLTPSPPTTLQRPSIDVTATRHVPVIGLVGGIGSGKSAVAQWVADKRNFVLIDGDQLASLMIDNGVGVERGITVEIVRIDHAFFEDA